MRTRQVAGMVAAALIAAMAGQATAAGPLGTNFTYQGRLTSAGVGQSASYDIRFQMYDAVTGGTLQGTVTKLAVPLANGVFTVDLDFGVQFTGDKRWLDIAVKPAGGPTYTVLTPRQELAPTPNAQCLRPLAYTGESEPGGSVVYFFNSDTTNNQSNGLGAQGYRGVYGLSTFGGTGSYGVYGNCTVSGGNGTYGVANTGTNAYGVWGESTQGYGVVGDSSSGFGGSFSTGSGLTGLLGSTSSTASGSTGVQGLGGESGVRGESVSSYGVFGKSTGSGGTGVQGVCDNGASAWGVGGSSTTGIGVFGSGPQGGFFSGTGGGIGVQAYGAQALRGDSTTGGGGSYGAYGLSTSANGTGVYGEATAGTAAYGVWGRSATGYAGVFSGAVMVNGNLSKSGGSFKIDHPLDPANKYLYHSFVESPDMMNIYNGNAVLDGVGAAVITMPTWFEALNVEFRYQLTPIGAPGPNLYVATEMTNGQFAIAGGTPGGKVSWQVTGIRHDPWANAHRIPVEESKQGAEQGRFIHPELFGYDESLSIDNLKPRAAASAQDPESLINKAARAHNVAPGARPVVKENK